MGERDDGLDLSLSLGFGQQKEPSLGLSLGFGQQKEPSLGLNLMPLITSSSSFPHMHKQNNNSHPQKIHHNSSTHLFQSFGMNRITGERNSDAGTLLRGFDVNKFPSSAALVDLEEDVAAVVSSPNSTVSSVSGNKRSEKELAAARGGGDENEVERASCSGGGGSDDEDGGKGDGSRKKLRLSKEQARVLEENFKEHSTLNPKQKQALGKELNLKARQVEVWFQNRRARTKLKQTEVDYEYLKRCCDNLTEENRRLQKEVSELRALKLSPHDLYMHMTPPPSPPTLTMCPSCERVSSSAATTVTAAPLPSPTTVVARPVPKRLTPWTAISLQQSSDR